MNKINIEKVIIVEGKYDKIKLSSVVEATIIMTDGFGIFTNKQKQTLIRTLAKKSGVIVFTDSDVAGFRIRRFIHSIVEGKNIYHAYIPDVYGKERRKVKASKEGKLGVEGIDCALLAQCLIQAGLGEEITKTDKKNITKQDFYMDGLTGSPQSSVRREKLIAYFGLPEYLTTNSLIDILNKITDYEEYEKAVETL